MFYVFLLVVAALAIGFYLLFLLNLVPGMKEERLGVLEPLPADLGKWITDETSEAGRAARAEGLLRETRHFHYEAGSGGKLVLQARVRNPETDEIVRVEEEQVVKRRRIRQASS